MKTLFRRAAVSALGLAALAAPAAAQGARCADWAQARMALAETYGEAVVGAGVRSGGMLVVVTASPDGATWSVLAVTPAGMACLLAEGSDWTGTAVPSAPAIPGGTLN